MQIDYWNYRERLRKYFVMIGDKPGQSIVADRIYWAQSPENCTNDPDKNTSAFHASRFKITNDRKREAADPNETVIDYWGYLNYGDATLDYDWYLGVLATEYWLLHNTGKAGSDEEKAVLNEFFFTNQAHIFSYLCV